MQPKAAARTEHWPALDGLRGLAVAAVIAYHLGYLKGGYLGVDLFFVLSGFLITHLLLREHEARGRIALGAFWARRARRLLPALGATLVGTVVASRFILPLSRLPALRIDAFAAGAYVANWRFALGPTAGYFADQGVSPLRHTWSLAIEEQYYLLWPLLAVAALVVAKRTSRPPALTIGLTAAAGLLASAVWSALHAESWSIDRLYLGTDTRALAPLAGALLACLLHPWTTGRRARPTTARTLGPAVGGPLGLVALAAAAVTVSADQRWMYRGGFLAAAVAAAGAITGGTFGPSWFVTPLSLPPLRWLGERSYGLYLYSWPIQVLAAEQGLEGAGLAAFTVALAAFVAEVSYRWLEMPIRRRGHRSPTTAAGPKAAAGPTAAAARRVTTDDGYGPGVIAARAVAAAIVVGGAILAATATSARPDPLTTKTDAELRAEALRPAVTTASTSPAATTTTDPATKRVVPTDRPLRVLLVGDSVGYTIGTFAPSDLDQVAVDARAVVGCGLQISGPRPAGMVEVGAPDSYDECNGLIAQAEALGLAGQPDVALLVTGGWELADHEYQGKTVGAGDEAWAKYLRGLLQLRIASLTQTGAAVALWGDTCGLFEEDRARQRWYRDEVLEPVADERDDVVVIDPGNVLCDGRGEPRTDIAGVGDPRTDGAHFSEPGAAWFWRNWLVDALRTAAAGG